MEPIHFLHQRQSTNRVIYPGPKDQEIESILQASMSAPDHGGLTPWRFKVIKGHQAIQEFGRLNIEYRRNSDRPVTEKKSEAFARWIEQVPLIIAIGYEVHPARKDIPELEQMQATCCAVMQMMNAAYILGYGAFWGTGMATHIPEFAELLGFQPNRYLGYIAIGSLLMPFCPKQRASYKKVSSLWPEDSPTIASYLES